MAEAFATPALPLPAVLQRLAGPLAARLCSGRELAALQGVATHDEPRSAPWSTALPGLARLLPGGLPRGELVELTAGRSSGRFAWALMLLAAATSAGENAALIDLGDALDPQSAAPAGIAWHLRAFPCGECRGGRSMGVRVSWGSAFRLS